MEVRVGTVLHGSCGCQWSDGAHGDCCRVEAVGADWVVARRLRWAPNVGEAIFMGERPEQLEEYTVPDHGCTCGARDEV